MRQPDPDFSGQLQFVPQTTMKQMNKTLTAAQTLLAKSTAEDDLVDQQRQMFSGSPKQYSQANLPFNELKGSKNIFNARSSSLAIPLQFGATQNLNSGT